GPTSLIEPRGRAATLRQQVRDAPVSPFDGGIDVRRRNLRVLCKLSPRNGCKVTVETEVERQIAKLSIRITRLGCRPGGFVVLLLDVSDIAAFGQGFFGSGGAVPPIPPAIQAFGIGPLELLSSFVHFAVPHAFRVAEISSGVEALSQGAEASRGGYGRGGYGRPRCRGLCGQLRCADRPHRGLGRTLRCSSCLASSSFGRELLDRIAAQ